MGKNTSLIRVTLAVSPLNEVYQHTRRSYLSPYPLVQLFGCRPAKLASARRVPARPHLRLPSTDERLGRLKRVKSKRRGRGQSLCCRAQSCLLNWRAREGARPRAVAFISVDKKLRSSCRCKKEGTPGKIRDGMPLGARLHWFDN